MGWCRKHLTALSVPTMKKFRLHVELRDVRKRDRIQRSGQGPLRAEASLPTHEKALPSEKVRKELEALMKLRRALEVLNEEENNVSTECRAEMLGRDNEAPSPGHEQAEEGDDRPGR